METNVKTATSNVSTSVVPMNISCSQFDVNSDDGIYIEKHSWRELLFNPYFYSRILITFTNIFIIILSIFYAIGERLSLILDNYWCDTKTLQQVRKHSINYNLPQGDYDSCWATKHNAV